MAPSRILKLALAVAAAGSLVLAHDSPEGMDGMDDARFVVPASEVPASRPVCTEGMCK